ncbi:hypothetical protein MY4824_009455 [Beauveria thailandica]
MSGVSNPPTVLITGAAGGLGRVLATAFLSQGANVAVCDINDDRLTETSNLWAEQYSGKFSVHKTDVSSLSDTERLIRSVTEKFGRLDILINNAAVLDKFDSAGTCPLEIWNNTLRVNLTGAFICTKVAVNTMQAQTPPGGSIINIGSNASVLGVSAGLAYTVSKHGILALTRNTAAFYLEHDITCMMLQLGALQSTNMQDTMADGVNLEGLGMVEKYMPRFKPGFSDVPLADVAKFCVMLMDRDLAKTLNGAAVPLNRNWPAGI